MRIGIYNDIIEKCNEDENFFATLSSDLKNNENFLNALIEARANDSRWFVCNDDILRECLPAVTESPEMLAKVLSKLRGIGDEVHIDDLIPDTLKANKAVMMAAATHIAPAALMTWLEDVDPELLCDREFMLPCISRCGESFQHLPHSLRTDKAFVIECIEVNDAVYPALPDKLKLDSEVAIAYVFSRRHETRRNIFQGVPDELMAQRDFVLAVTDRLLEKPRPQGAFTANNLDPSLRCDREVMLNAVKLNPMNMNYASSKLRNDKDFVLTALKANADHPCFQKEEFYFKVGPELMARINESQKLKSLERIDFAQKLEADLPSKETPKKTTRLKL